MPRRRADADEPLEDLVPVTIRFPASLRKRAIDVALAEDRNFSSLARFSTAPCTILTLKARRTLISDRVRRLMAACSTGMNRS